MQRQVSTVGLFLMAISSFTAIAAQGQAAGSQTSSPAQSSSALPDSQITENSSSTASRAAAVIATKKVWTNDDVGDLRGHSAISTVGVSSAKAQKPGPAAQVANAETVKSYRDRILALKAKLPPIDSQISDLEGVLNGQTMNSTRHATGAKIDDWHDELTRLKQQKSDIETKVSALEDEARHKGVPENQIPE